MRQKVPHSEIPAKPAPVSEGWAGSFLAAGVVLAFLAVPLRRWLLVSSLAVVLAMSGAFVLLWPNWWCHLFPYETSPYLLGAELASDGVDLSSLVLYMKAGERRLAAVRPSPRRDRLAKVEAEGTHDGGARQCPIFCSERS